MSSLLLGSLPVGARFPLDYMGILRGWREARRETAWRLEKVVARDGLVPAALVGSLARELDERLSGRETDHDLTTLAYLSRLSATVIRLKLVEGVLLTGGVDELYKAKLPKVAECPVTTEMAAVALVTVATGVQPLAIWGRAPSLDGLRADRFVRAAWLHRDMVTGKALEVWKALYASQRVQP